MSVCLIPFRFYSRSVPCKAFVISICALQEREDEEGEHSSSTLDEVTFPIIRRSFSSRSLLMPGPLLHSQSQRKDVALPSVA